MIRSELVNKIDDYGEVVVSPDDVVKYLLEGHDISGVKVSDVDVVEQYKHMVNLTGRENFPEINKPKEHKESPEKVLKRKSQFWTIPVEYQSMDIISYLVGKCSTEDEKLRVAEELVEFERRNELMILRVMVYIVDQFRKNNVVWGVGRGSSVSCFCFYLIGINKINPMVYDIPYTEYFKDNE